MERLGYRCLFGADESGGGGLDGSGSSNEFMSIVAREYFAGMNCMTLPLIRLESDFSAGLPTAFGDFISRPDGQVRKG